MHRDPSISIRSQWLRLAGNHPIIDQSAIYVIAHELCGVW